MIFPGIDYQYIEINPYEAPSDGDEEDDGKYTKKALSLSRKRELYPDFVEASPRGLVPAMRNDSDVLSDSTVILEYIDEAFTCQGESLFPSTSPSSRAKARFWSIFINEKIIPHYYKMLMQPSTDDRETAKLNLLGGLIELAGVMSAEGPFFFGETFGIVDIMLAPWWLRILSVSKFYRNFEVPRGKSTSTPADPSVNVTPEDEAYSRLHQWYAAVRHRRSFVRTVMNEEELIRNYAGDFYGHKCLVCVFLLLQWSHCLIYNWESKTSHCVHAHNSRISSYSFGTSSHIYFHRSKVASCHTILSNTCPHTKAPTHIYSHQATQTTLRQAMQRANSGQEFESQ